MKTFLRTSTCLAALLLLLDPCSPRSVAAMEGWHTDFGKALEQARREGKPLLADVGSDNCPACRKLEAETLSDPQIRSRLQNFVKVQINGDHDPRVLHQFGINAYPTVLAIDPNGQEVERSIGFVKAGRFAGTLDNAMRKIGPSLAKLKARSVPEDRPVRGAQDDMSRMPREEEPQDMREEEPAAVQAAAGRRSGEPAPRGAMRAMPREESVETADGSQETADGSQESAEGAGLASAKTRKPTASETAAEKVTASDKPAKAEKLLASEKNAEAEKNSGAERMAPVKESKLLAQVSTSRNRESALDGALPAPSDDLPERLIRLDGSAPVKAGSPTKSGESKTVASNAPQARTAASTDAEEKGDAKPQVATASASGVPSTIKRLQSAGASSTAGTATEPPASVADIESWMAEADAHLKAMRKKEARAMYGKVVRLDPTNRSGKSDLAFIQKVMLSVDDDDDALRRKAYQEICRFKELYPDSPREDHYTVMRAILAADLGMSDQAHRLLDTFKTRFEKSRFLALAHRTWKSLPPVKEGSSKDSKATARSSSSSEKSKSASSASSKSTTKSAKPASTSSKKASAKTTADAGRSRTTEAEN